jgi:hypothetical protein
MADCSKSDGNGAAPAPLWSVHQNNYEPSSLERVNISEGSSSEARYPWRKRIQENVLLNLSPTHYSLDEPKLPYVSGIVSMLMLASSLACIAGVDAMVHCHSQQVYEINELFDDDAVIFTQLQRVQEEYSCQHMFRSVMIPITVITIVCGILTKCLIAKLYENIQKEYHLFVKILCISVLVLISWTYGIFCIMLRPKNLRNTQDVNNSYQSLAAVDQMGHVGDNANLYYLTWICFGLSLAIVYEVSIETVRRRRMQSDDSLPNNVAPHDANVEVTATTTSQLQFFKDSRESWYHSLYRLRIRSGIWVAAFVATIVILTSSLLMWNDVLRPAASATVGHDMRFLGVCNAIQNSSNNGDSSWVPPELCIRTAFSIISGATATMLCLTAIIIHASTRRVARQVSMELSSAFFREHSILGGPLKAEFILSTCLCTLLGLNAVFATAVQGPAATVGNLYYASWTSFLLCLRILLGCLEEMYNLHHEQDDEDSVSSSMPTKSVSTDATSTAIMSPDLFDNQRARRARRYLFLGIVSTICSASALDACFNQSSDLSWDQQYVIIAPTVVALLCAIQFSMCLGPVSYVLISSNLIGGTLAVLMFLVCFVALIITMHSERSWAVDAIGDIKIANLYYFSWASIVTAGLHMSAFLTKLLGIHDEDYMCVMWGVLVKVSAVILSASFHIWHNIKDTCSLQDIKASAIDFCSRTVFALMVSVIGICVGGVVVLSRLCVSLCCPAFPPRIRFHVELIVSCFLVLVFAVALAVITGIGGPGQSVGDLFYATWLAFLVSLGIAVSCYGELRNTVSEEWKQKDGEPRETNFIQMISQE